MSDPTAFTASYNFSGFQSVNPDTPLPGTQVDIQLAAIEVSTLALVNAVKDIRRADGALANQSVGPDQLADSLVIGFTLRGTWVDATAYSAGDGVVYGTSFYKALSAHTASVATRPDTDATTWEFLLTFESIIVADGAITPAKLSADAAGFRTALGLGTLAVEDVAYLDTRVVALTEKTTLVDDDLVPVIDSEAVNVGKKIKWSTFLAMIQAALVDPTPIGVVWDYAGTAAPTGWLFCYGQAISRATYADLFAAISTTYGAGDGSTTFNVPDIRGRVTAGQDDMGGSSANRLTAQTGGVNGDTLGAIGGAETHALLITQITSHTHGAGSYEAANHGHPGRFSTLNDANADGTLGGGFMLDNVTTETKVAFTGTAADTYGRQIGGSGALAVSGTSASAGSSAAHNNVQPTIILNKIIYAGV